MAQGKLSPRQRMINMMYLVLTALLALNVSKEIINAFVTVNDSLEVSNKNTTDKNAKAYADFEFAMKNDPVKTKPFYDKALAAKKLSDTMIAYLDGIKKDMVMKADKIEAGQPVPALMDMEDKENYDIPTHIMCGDANDGRGFKATEIKNKLLDLQKGLIQNVPAEDQAVFQKRFSELLSTKDPDPGSKVFKEDNKKTWEMANFYHNPVVATVALLTKMQADVKNAESEVISHLLRSIDVKSFKFDALEGRVIAPSSYVLIGQEYKADVFLAAYSSTANPDITVGDVDTVKKVMRGQGRKIDVVGGLGKYVDRPSTEGIKKWGGIIQVKNPTTNELESYPFTAEYVAAKPASVVSADKMNVLYIGVENPMSISVPGVANDLVRASPSGGGVTLTPDGKLGGGHYIAKATTQGECTFNVTAKLSGKDTPMGQFKFRVKRVPDPAAMIGGKKGGPINKNELLAQPSVTAQMENFDFNLFFKVTKFTMTLFKKGFPDPIVIESSTNRITEDMKSQIQRAGSGSRLYFEGIHAAMEGSNESARKIGLINFILQ